MSTSRPVRAVLAAVLTAAAFAAGGCASAQTSTAAPAVAADGVARVQVDFSGGAVTGGSTRYAVPLGSTVELVVASDVADEIHVHGYDRTAFVTAGATATLRFVADVPGVFEVELEQRGTPLAQLQVS